jgi:hypothetical protein
MRQRVSQNKYKLRQKRKREPGTAEKTGENK